jgi:hypothetical protein
MNFNASKSMMLLAAALAGGISFSARAEEGIIFSRPTNSVENADSLLTPQAQLAPPSQPFDFDPGLQPSAPWPQANNSLRDSLNARKNWMWMTPEEILGVPTRDEILGLPPDPNEKDLTPEQRFLKRQQSASISTTSNSWSGTDKILPGADKDDLFQTSDAKKEWNWQSGMDTVPVSGTTKYVNQFLNAPESPTVADENPDSAWRSAFALPEKKNQEQLDDQKATMERFREMMQATPDSAPTMMKFAAPPRDPNLQEMLQDNPAGHSFAQLQNSMLKPTGIDPLASATGSRPQAAKKKSTLDSESDLPPWLRDGPQPGIPQRKF